MSRETFKEYQPGDLLSAATVNKLSRAARKVENLMPGSYSQGMEGSRTGLVPFEMRVVQVVASEDDEESSQSTSSSSKSFDASVSNEVYNCRPMYYDHDESAQKWMLDEDAGPFDLDPVLGGEYLVGDRLIAYYDPQRGAYLPISPPLPFLLAKAESSVANNSVGEFSVWNRNTTLGEYDTNDLVDAKTRFGPVSAGSWCLLVRSPWVKGSLTHRWEVAQTACVIS